LLINVLTSSVDHPLGSPSFGQTGFFFFLFSILFYRLKAETESGRAPIRGIWKFEDNNVTEEDLFGNMEERLKEQDREEAAAERLALEAQSATKAAAPKEEL
jgi:hypothetical protein